MSSITQQIPPGIDMINNNFINTERINHFKETLATNSVKEKNRLQSIFENSLTDVSADDCCIFVTGSHGRREKGEAGQVELIVAFKRELSKEQKNLIKARIENLVKAHHTEFDSKIEYQTFKTGSKVIAYEDKLIPTRAFDSMRVWGSKIIKKDYYTTMFSQISSLNSKEYSDFSKNFRQASIRQLSENIKNSTENKENKKENLKPFDLNTGTLFYDGKKTRASKFPFLRTVQYQLAHQIFQAIKAKKMSEKQFNELRKQRTVPKKLEWMIKNNFFKTPEKELNNLANAYMVSLIWYESAEKGFQSGNQEMQVDLNQLKDLTNTIHKFAKNQS